MRLFVVVLPDVLVALVATGFVGGVLIVLAAGCVSLKAPASVSTHIDPYSGCGPQEMPAAP